MEAQGDFDPYKTHRKPRKIPKIKRSPFEYGSSLSNSKKYWEQVFQEKDISSNGSSNIVLDHFMKWMHYENNLQIATPVQQRHNCRNGQNLKESKKMFEVLPRDLYEKVCDILDIPIIKQVSEDAQLDTTSSPRRSTKEPFISFRTSLHIDRELSSDTDVEFCPSDHEEEFNVHKQLLRKPVREQITWATRYLIPEREDEKSLVKKADDLTDRIATEFCKYMQELGGDHQSQLFTPKAIKELFQIEFDTHVARGLRVITKELPSVDERVAIATGHPEKSRYEVLEREVTKDIIAEKKQDITRAFGSGLAWKDQYRAPRNDTRQLWRSARYVPKDLVTLKTVWEGITNIRSVKEYCRWMIDHPEHRKPPYLNSLGMFDRAVLDATQSQEANEPSSQLMVSEETAPIDHIRRRLSELAD